MLLFLLLFGEGAKLCICCFVREYDEHVSVRIEISRNSVMLANPPGPLFV